jgi:ATP-dependent Lon protease
MKAHGLQKKNLKISGDTIRSIINYYTREAGVRNLEREIANVCRKAARALVSGNKKSVTITPSNIEKYLGTRRFRYDKANEKDEVGLATGLAWTPVGGDTLAIEVTIMDGSGKLELTGQLGDVMKESAMAAVSFIRSKAELLGIDKEFYKKYDIHIHVPEGATPKDGPSAGITLAAAMASALTGRAVRRNVAMTGEITLRGRILPIGGVKEKVLAAHRAGIDTVVLPTENRKDIDEIPDNVKSVLKFVFADNMDAVLNTALAADKSRKDVKSTGEDQDTVLLTSESAITEEQGSTHQM